MTVRSPLLAALAVAGVATAAHAAPLDGVDPAWTVDIGLIGRVRPTHMGSDRYTNDILPILQASHGDRLTISIDDGATATLWRRNGWSIGPVVEYRQSYNDHLPKGAFAMEDAVEVGGFVKGRAAVGEIDLRLRKAVTGYGGWSGDLAFDTGGQVSPRWKIGAEARLSWADSAFSREYFGLRRRAFQPVGFPRFGENDFYSAGLELDAARTVNRRTAIVFTLSGDRILGEEWRSRLLADRNIITAGVGVTYRFGRPDTGAGDQP
jgi:outer membrane scaffolding protein for murein synthesis (MipA/OmpV family)